MAVEWWGTPVGLNPHTVGYFEVKKDFMLWSYGGAIRSPKYHLINLSEFRVWHVGSCILHSSGAGEQCYKSRWCYYSWKALFVMSVSMASSTLLLLHVLLAFYCHTALSWHRHSSLRKLLHLLNTPMQNTDTQNYVNLFKFVHSFSLFKQWCFPYLCWKPQPWNASNVQE